jgi:hypothetical protein
MSKTWDGKASGYYLNFDGQILTGDPATLAVISNAIENKDVIGLTATGPNLVVTMEDHASVSKCASDFWYSVLTLTQFQKATWNNPPFILPESDDPFPEGIVY